MMTEPATCFLEIALGSVAAMGQLGVWGRQGKEICQQSSSRAAPGGKQVGTASSGQGMALLSRVQPA